MVLFVEAIPKAIDENDSNTNFIPLVFHELDEIAMDEHGRM